MHLNDSVRVVETIHGFSQTLKFFRDLGYVAWQGVVGGGVLESTFTTSEEGGGLVVEVDEYEGERWCAEVRCARLRDSRCVVVAKCLEVDKEYTSHKGDICSFSCPPVDPNKALIAFEYCCIAKTSRSSLLLSVKLRLV
jgi:hypothetical protein